MTHPAWMQLEAPRRHWIVRTKGRRKADRAPRVETILGLAVLAAWAWGAYEVTLLFLRH
jgi:hypothetical protein